MTAADRTTSRALPLEAAQWREALAAHAGRADELTAVFRERRERGEKHAVEDFLFTYYAARPARLRRWHPGVGETLLPGSAADDVTEVRERLTWRWHTPDGDGVTLHVAAFLADRGDTVRYVRNLLARTSSRPANVGCFGLHEWAMVYRQGDATRHPLPLRLGARGTDEVVESHPVRCSHFDAFRFFTPEAAPLNRLQPTRENQPELEQPGCLHAGMDVYKWAYKLAPFTSAELIADCFALAREIRELDMRASPYDLREWGYSPVAIETAAGKAEYVAAQRVFATRAGELRRRLIDVADAVLAG